VTRAGLSRRDFLRRLGVGTAAVGAGYGLQVWQWAGPAGAARPRAGTLDGDGNGRSLVIVEMGGGNDGLNTVVPLNDGLYHDLRPTLAVTDPITLDASLSRGDVGFHPSLAKLAARFDRGEVALIEGLGYDDPDLSHFGSFGIWWSAKGGTGGGGWIGAYLDASVGFDDPLAAIGLGPGRSPALIGRQSFATTIASREGLQPVLPDWLDASDPAEVDDLLAAWSDFKPAEIDSTTLVGQVQRALGLTVKARNRLDDAISESDPAPESEAMREQRASYQDASVVDHLVQAAQLITSSAKPRVVYIDGIGDFDTHGDQATRHPELLQRLDDGIEAFFAELGPASDTAILMTVSEFGRRPRENGGGTDHGTTNVHFVVGPKVKGGRYGEPPSLSDLDSTNNLRHTADFRRLYATGLRWLGVDDTTPVLGDEYSHFPVFA
jgi:uncharacterized protein (DUF1501 family)